MSFSRKMITLVGFSVLLCCNISQAETTVSIMPSLIIIPDDNGCTFNGQPLQDGESITAYQNSTVAFGNQCISETRTCKSASLSGSYQFASCAVDQPASCLFNGQTISHGQTINAFISSSVSFGSLCQSEQRTCLNGVLSGSAAYASCAVDQAASCLFNGQTIAHGQAVKAFQNSSVVYGQSCISQDRLCDNGVLTGAYQFGSCSVDQPASCLFNGQTIAHGQVVTGFLSSTVPYGSSCQSEQRTCQNGILSGSANYASCAVDQPASCLFNGQTIAHGQVVTGFLSSTVPYGSSCQSEQRTCQNGILSGSANYASCAVDQPASCLFNGQTIAHGQVVTGFLSSTVPYGSSCQSEQRTCQNGILSGSYAQSSCSVQNPPPNPTPKNCSINGVTVPSGQSIKLFISPTVPYGSTCSFEERLCTDGVLSGSATYKSCNVQPKPPVTEPLPKDKCDKHIKHRDHHDHGKHLGEIKHGHIRKDNKGKNHDDDCVKNNNPPPKKPCDKDKEKHKPCDSDRDKNHDKKPCDKSKKITFKKPCSKKEDRTKNKPCDKKNVGSLKSKIENLIKKT
ncbi:MAG: hypothetical protein ACK4VO_09635 [Pseudobdellovibrio sp.]